jgi:hypothetical protein
MNQTITLTPKTRRILEQARKTEKKSSERILEEALERYVGQRKRWAQIRQWGSQTARNLGITKMSQVEEIVDEMRR